MLLTLLVLAQAAPAMTDERRGAEAVGARPSAEPAIRAEPAPSGAFALGASLAAWRNAAVAAEYDAAHTTGDGGDAEALAEDCSDERIAFNALEARRAAASAELRSVANRAGLANVVEAWKARRNKALAQCR